MAKLSIKSAYSQTPDYKAVVLSFLKLFQNIGTTYYEDSLLGGEFKKVRHVVASKSDLLLKS